MEIFYFKDQFLKLINLIFMKNVFLLLSLVICIVFDCLMNNWDYFSCKEILMDLNTFKSPDLWLKMRIFSEWKVATRKMSLFKDMHTRDKRLKDLTELTSKQSTQITELIYIVV